MNRRRIREPLVRRRPRKLLNHIPEIILVDIVNRWLMVLRWLLGLSLHTQFRRRWWRRRRLRKTLILIKTRIRLNRRIKPRLLNKTRFGNFVGKLVEMPKILVPACRYHTSAIISGGGIPSHRRLAAFLHFSYKKNKTQMAGPPVLDKKKNTIADLI